MIANCIKFPALWPRLSQNMHYRDKCFVEVTQFQILGKNQRISTIPRRIQFAVLSDVKKIMKNKQQSIIILPNYLPSPRDATSVATNMAALPSRNSEMHRLDVTVVWQKQNQLHDWPCYVRALAINQNHNCTVYGYSWGSHQDYAVHISELWRP